MEPVALATEALREGLPERSSVNGFVGLITPARCRFESTTIQNGDIATAVAEKVPSPQVLRGYRDARAAHTQHPREELVRDMEGLGMRPVLGREEPSREPRLDDVESRT